MNVSEAVASRFSTRAFIDSAVEPGIIRRVFEKARQAPSGGNLQPWHVHVLTGKVLEDFRKKIAQLSETSLFGGDSEYEIYPPNLADPFRSRRYKCGEDLYEAIGIPREDRPARLRQYANNLRFFGAPVGIFFSIERFIDSNQWAHVGMFMQTIMLLAREEGLHTCPQECWATWQQEISEFLDLPEDRMFYCGMAMGYADEQHPINNWRTERESLDQLVQFCGFD